MNKNNVININNIPKQKIKKKSVRHVNFYEVCICLLRDHGIYAIYEQIISFIGCFYLNNIQKKKLLILKELCSLCIIRLSDRFRNIPR